jgi:hypothetical protein
MLQGDADGVSGILGFMLSLDIPPSLGLDWPIDGGKRWAWTA